MIRGLVSLTGPMGRIPTGTANGAHGRERHGYSHYLSRVAGLGIADDAKVSASPPPAS